MLVIQAQENEKIQIGEAIVQVFIRNGYPVLKIKAPAHIHICRETAKDKTPKDRSDTSKLLLKETT